MNSILSGGKSIEGIGGNIGYAILRVYVGLSLAFGHGTGKLPPSEGFIQRVEDMGFPFPDFFAYAAGVSEFVGGILVTLGLLTRPSSIFILITMLVAGLVRHWESPFDKKELALAYACCAIMFMVVGAGKYGLDALTRSRRRQA
jgi:putative oxidoreductase